MLKPGNSAKTAGDMVSAGVSACALGKSAKPASTSGMTSRVVVLSFINGFMILVLSFSPLSWFSAIAGPERANNLHGDNNTAMGFQALNANTTDGNTAVGFQALRSNTTGIENTAVGFQALSNNLASGDHCAFGVNALLNTTTGSFANNAFGAGALDGNTTGSRNIAVGDDALGTNVTGSDNTAVGDSAGFSITGDNNICIGSGVSGTAAENNTIRIGAQGTQTATFIAGIRDVDPPGTEEFVVINASGQLGSVSVAFGAAAASMIQELKSTVAQQQKQIEALTEGLQKVSAQLEASKPAPQVVANGQ